MGQMGAVIWLCAGVANFEWPIMLVVVFFFTFL